MKTLLFLLEKEFRQILRNKGIVRMLIIAPVIQLILLPLAADYSVKNILKTVKCMNKFGALVLYLPF